MLKNEGRADTPYAAYLLLSREVTIGAVAILLGLSAVAWVATVDQSTSMSGMVRGLGQVGESMPAFIAAPVFLGMWVVMMVAMMFPAFAPVVLAHRAVVRLRGEGLLPTVAFVAGYLTVWAVVGVVPLAALVGIRLLSAEAAGQPWLPMLAGAALVAAGAYQFTAWKSACLKACRSPLTFLLTHDFSAGVPGALRAGASHGLYCLGCCWALMSVLLVVGLMNLVWMAALTLVVLAERNWSRGLALSKIVGLALILIGTAVTMHPFVLSGIAG